MVKIYLTWQIHLYGPLTREHNVQGHIVQSVRKEPLFYEHYTCKPTYVDA